MTSQTAYKITKIYLNKFGDRFFKIRGCEFIRTSYLDGKIPKKEAIRMIYRFLRLNSF